jgi:hypothetical protein
MFSMALGFVFCGPWNAFAAQSASSSNSSGSQGQSDSAVVGLTPENEKESTYLMCQNGSNVRTIRFLPMKAGGCKTGYTKEGGTEQIVAESWSKSRCLSVMNNIRENLIHANWKCRDISNSRISSSLNE